MADPSRLHSLAYIDETRWEIYMRASEDVSSVLKNEGK